MWFGAKDLALLGDALRHPNVRKLTVSCFRFRHVKITTALTGSVYWYKVQVPGKTLEFTKLLAGGEGRRGRRSPSCVRRLELRERAVRS